MHLGRFLHFSQKVVGVTLISHLKNIVDAITRFFELLVDFRLYT